MSLFVSERTEHIKVRHLEHKLRIHGTPTCELVYTESGYAEEDCVLRTADSSPLGSGVWVITRHEPSSLFELVRVTPHLLIRLKIELIDNGDGTTHTKWSVLLTGITDQGNEIVERAPDDEAKHRFLMACLERYLKTGEMLEPAPTQ